MTYSWNRDQVYHVCESVTWLLRKLNSFRCAVQDLQQSGMQALRALEWLREHLPGFAMEYEPVVRSLHALDWHASQRQLAIMRDPRCCCTCWSRSYK